MKIVILGAGRMGVWLAEKFSSANEVGIYDVDRAKADGLSRTKVLKTLSEIEALEPQFLINAVTLENAVSAFEEAAPYTPKDCIICDVASIKAGLAGYYGKAGRRFVSVHPLFGPSSVDVESPGQGNAIIIEGSDPEGARFFKEFFESMGVKVFEYSFDEHDQVIAYSFTLPFFSSTVFAGSADRRAVPGSTFAKYRRAARDLLSEDNRLLKELLFNPYSLFELERITGKLEYLKHILRDKDYEELESLLGKLRENVG